VHRPRDAGSRDDRQKLDSTATQLMVTSLVTAAVGVIIAIVAL
jgi:hypothetical protein